MRATLWLVPVFAFSLSGCKKIDELEAALEQTKSQLVSTETELSQEQEKNKQLEADNQSLQDKIAQMEAELAQLNAQIKDLADKAGLTQKELAELRKEKRAREKELKVYKDLVARLKAMVEAGTIKLAFRKGRVIVQLDNSILFDSGKTKLKDEGQAALGQLTKALSSLKDRDWLVAGHTDNIPIRTKRFKSNWQLSTARSVEVVSYMIEQGMPPQHVGAAGFGEFDPVGDNKTETGRAENRRIEVILMPRIGAIPGMKEMLQGK